MQPLKYLIVDEDKYADKVFETVKWEGYIAPDGDPKVGEEPTAYIVILADTEIKKGNYQHDAGAAAENIMLAALEEGIGSCWIGSIDREELREILSIPESLEIDTIIALGYPAEESAAEEYSGSIKYYKDEKGTLHVPKRNLKDLVLFNKLLLHSSQRNPKPNQGKATLQITITGYAVLRVEGETCMSVLMEVMPEIACAPREVRAPL